MANQTMVSIFDEILDELRELGFSKGSIQQYTRYFKKMQDYFTEREASEYSERILDEYLLFVTQRETPYAQKYLSSLQKSVDIVRKYAAGEGVCWAFRCRGSRYNPSQYFQDIIDASIEYFHFTASRLPWYRYITRKFCCGLEKKGIVSFSDLGLSDVSQIITKFGQSNPNSMDSVTHYISKFLLYLNKVGACTVQIESSLYVPCSRKKLIPAYSADEL
ncbi:MAG: hypothetical protein JEY71_18115, partial [Sphaerochaeta sp.]|nr:hypothetical protein [Sphaerochaeta sp.]